MLLALHVIAARKVSTSSSLRDILKLESCRAFDDFCRKLYLALDDCFASVGQVRYQLARERTFTNFHRVRQERLPLIWAHFFVQLKVPPINALQQQTINFQLLNDMAVKKFATRTKCEKSPARVHLSWEEGNAIRYAGGYVINKLTKQYMKMETAKAGQLVECLLSMGNAVSQESSQAEITSCSIQWINTINRGGLFHINDEVMIFLNQ